MKKLFSFLIFYLLFCAQMIAQTTASSLTKEGQAAFDKKDFAASEKCYKEAMKLYENGGQTRTADYAMCLHNIGRSLISQQKYKDAKAYTKRAMDLRKELLGELSDDYILSLSNYALIYCMEDDYATAKKLQLQAVSLCERLGHKHPKTFLIYDNMARYCTLTKDGDSSLKYWDVALASVEKYGKEYESALQVMDKAASMDLFKKEESLDHVMELLSDFNNHELSKGNMSPDDMLGAAQWLAVKGDYTKCRETYSKLLQKDIKDSLRVEVESKYGDFLFDNMKDNISAAEHYMAGAEIEKRTKGTTTKYNDLIYHAYVAYKEGGDSEKAARCRKQAKDYIDRIESKGVKADDTKTSLDDASYESDTKALLKEDLKYLNSFGKYFGDFERAKAYGSICSEYTELHKYKEAIDYAEKYVNSMREALRNQFRMLDYSEREAMWKEERFNVEGWENLFSLTIGDSKYDRGRLASLMYDFQLLRKGILLNSSISFMQVIEESGDASLKADYTRMRELQKEIASLRSSDRQSDLNSILEKDGQLKDLQLSVYKRCTEFADYTDYMSYSWKDVQAKLGAKDVAIEFAMVGGPDDLISMDKNMRALIITRDMKQPVCVTLAKVRDFMQLPSLDKPLDFSRINQKKPERELGEILWNPLSRYLEGRKRIYFSADNLFNCMAIEYFNYGTSIMSEQFEMYRLSSTKELCRRSEDQRPGNVVLIGGIDYGKMATDVSTDTRQKLSALRGFRESDEGFAQLPCAEDEINCLSGIYSKSRPVLLKGSEASEKAFRLLSGKRFGMLHISTHGSYISVRGRRQNTADAMNNSILALSGANEGSDDTANDGIVTASDIAAMNLRKCDLVVLSACQTGLGQIADDGVFGLQRGFKNAGVGSLLITLASVYDESTAMLMEEFHKNLSSGRYTKMQALNSAQKYLRQHGYDDPKYWAVFILLDAKN